MLAFASFNKLYNHLESLDSNRRLGSARQRQASFADISELATTDYGFDRNVGRVYLARKLADSLVGVFVGVGVDVGAVVTGRREQGGCHYGGKARLRISVKAITQ